MIFKEKENKNKNFDNNKNLFSVIITSYKEKIIEKKSDVYFIIQITDNCLKITWEIEKTIEDFHNLYEKLFIVHPYLPLIPKKTVFKIKSPHILDKREYDLQYFLKFCFNRKDILLNEDFLDFVEIKTKCKKIAVNILNKEEEMHFDLSVTDFLYIKNKGILIVQCKNNDFISSDEINLDNILLIRNDFSGKKIPLSFIYIYEIIKENEKIKINKLYEKSFFIRIERISFDENKEILVIGNDDGKIHLYKTKIRGEFKQMENFGELSFHNEKITGLYLNPDNMELFSCSLDSMLFVSNLKESLFNKSLIYNNMSGFTALKYIKEKNIIITSDEDGFISIFFFNNLHYILFASIQTTLLETINSIFSTGNLVFGGCKNGKICMIDISQLSDKKFKEIKSIDIDSCKINCITYNNKREEIIIGNEKGNIIIWNKKIDNYIYCWKAHTPYSIRHLWLDENYVLWSSGDDKKIKKWKFPDKWFNEEIYLFNSNYEEKKTKKNIFDLGESEGNISSDEDELKGWSKNL